MPKGVKPDDPDYRKRPNKVGQGPYVSVNPRGRVPKGKQRMTIYKDVLTLLAEIAGHEPTHILITPAPRSNIYIEPTNEHTPKSTTLFRHHRWGNPATCHFPAKLLDHIEAEEETLHGVALRDGDKIKIMF